MSTRIFTLIMNKIYLDELQNHEANDYVHDLNHLANHLAVIACFISYEMWVSE